MRCLIQVYTEMITIITCTESFPVVDIKHSVALDEIWPDPIVLPQTPTIMRKYINIYSPKYSKNDKDRVGGAKDITLLGRCCFLCASSEIQVSVLLIHTLFIHISEQVMINSLKATLSETKNRISIIK